MSKKIIINKENLRSLYWVDELTQKEIGKHFGVDEQTIHARMNEYGIPRRDYSQCLSVSFKKNPLRRQKQADYLRQHQPKPHPAWNKGIPMTEENKLKLYKANKGRPSKLKGCKHTIEARRKMSLSHKGKPSLHKGKQISFEQKMKISRANLGQWANHSHEKQEEIRRKLQAAQLRRWANISHKDKQKWLISVLKAISIKPNKPERTLDNILTKDFPQFRYNGDGSLRIVLAGLIPDFVNVNGKKQIIEVFGLYWHGKRVRKWHQTELGRIMAYKSIGWDCLVIWENELKKPEAVIEKIKEFTNNKKVGVI